MRLFASFVRNEWYMRGVNAPILQFTNTRKEWNTVRKCTNVDNKREELDRLQ